MEKKMNTPHIIQKPARMQLIIVLAAAFAFIPFLGGVHLFDWDEANFAESAREMITSGNYLQVQVDYVPFWEKPPLFIWMQVASMKVFGVNEFAARLPNAICGIFTLLIIFRIGRRLYNERFALYWVLFYGCSWLPLSYFKSGIIDPWFNLFIFAGIYGFVRYIDQLKKVPFEKSVIRWLVISSFFLGLAVLTKGPVAILVFVLAFGVFFLLARGKMPLRLPHILIFVLVLALVGGFWFILQIANGNSKLILDFIRYQVKLFSTHDAGHGGFLLYHFIVLLFGVFPASLFAIPALFAKQSSTETQALFERWMKILFWTVLILFTIVKTKIVHYSSLCYFPLTFLASLYAYKLFTSGKRPAKWLRLSILVYGVLIAILVALVPFLDRFKGFIISHGWISDSFAVANLQANGGWTGLEGGISLWLLAGIIVFLSNRSKLQVALYGLLIGTAGFMLGVLILYAPRIEKYSQGAAIDFYKKMAGKAVFVNTLEFKSYACLFYTGKPGRLAEEPDSALKYLTCKLDRDAYFLCKINRREHFLKNYPQLEYLYDKNGFVFLLRPYRNTDSLRYTPYK